MTILPLSDTCRYQKPSSCLLSPPVRSRELGYLCTYRIPDLARIMLPYRSNPRSNFWASACAEARGGGVRDQGRPSHFLWLFLGRSFDLFLTKTAETQATGSLALHATWQWPGDGKPRGSGARPGSSSHQRRWQAGMQPPHPLLHPSCSCPGGRGQVGKGKKQQRAPSHPLGQPEPVASMRVFFFFLV